MDMFIITGRIASRIEVEEGIAKFTVASPRHTKNEEGIYETDFFHIETTLIEKCAYLNLGDFVGIKGTLQTKNSEIVLNVERISFLQGGQNE